MDEYYGLGVLLGQGVLVAKGVLVLVGVKLGVSVGVGVIVGGLLWAGCPGRGSARSSANWCR